MFLWEEGWLVGQATGVWLSWVRMPLNTHRSLFQQQPLFVFPPLPVIFSLHTPDPHRHSCSCLLRFFPHFLSTITEGEETKDRAVHWRHLWDTGIQWLALNFLTGIRNDLMRTLALPVTVSPASSLDGSGVVLLFRYALMFTRSLQSSPQLTSLLGRTQGLNSRFLSGTAFVNSVPVQNPA